jgi:hypothetical protein
VSTPLYLRESHCSRCGGPFPCNKKPCVELNARLDGLLVEFDGAVGNLKNAMREALNDNPTGATVKDHQHVCDHGVPVAEYCHRCDEPWPRSAAPDGSSNPQPKGPRCTVDCLYFPGDCICEEGQPLVRGGQGRSNASTRSDGVWAGVAILALSAGTVVWLLLRWFSRF